MTTSKLGLNDDMNQFGELQDLADLFLDAPESPLSSTAFEALLALADDEFVIAHRYSEWLALSPFLEEDLTLASIAQDEFGHARALYSLIWPAWKERDALVVRRPPNQWRSAPLVEKGNGPWEDLLVRHWLYDLAEEHRWTGIVAQFGTQVEGLTALGTKVAVEERFHRRHAGDLINRLAQSSDAATRLDEALERLRPYCDGLALGATDSAALNFSATVADVCFHDWATSEFGVGAGELRASSGADHREFGPGPSVASGSPAATLPSANGSTRTIRSSDFNTIARSLLAVVAFDPTARW